MASFTNQASLRYRGSVIASNVVTGELLVSVTMTKTSTDESYTAGQRVSYAIGIDNNTGALEGLTLTDDLGAIVIGGQTRYPLTYVDGSVRLFIDGELQTAPTVSTAQGLQFDGINIPAGSSAVLLYDAQVTEYAPLGSGSTIENTVTLTGDSLTEPITAQYSLAVLEDALLSVVKSVTPTSVQPDEPLSYSFLLQNSGNLPAQEGLVLEDVFYPVLTGLRVTLNGALLTEDTDYSYDDQTGEFATVAGKITVPAATFTQDPVSGVWTTTPGEALVVVTGTV